MIVLEVYCGRGLRMTPSPKRMMFDLMQLEGKSQAKLTPMYVSEID